MVTKAVNGRTKLSTKVFQVLHMQTHCVFSCTNSLSLLLTVFLPYLCPCYCPGPGNGPSAHSTFQSLPGPSQRRVDDNCQGSHGFPRELPYALVGLAIQDSLAPTGQSALIFFFFFFLFACFRQHILYQKGLCQKLEMFLTMGKKIP